MSTFILDTTAKAIRALIKLDGDQAGSQPNISVTITSTGYGASPKDVEVQVREEVLRILREISCRS